MANRSAKKHPVTMDQKQLDKLRRTLSKSIDDFKDTVMDSLTVSKETLQGPLHEGLLPDPISVKSTNEASVVNEDIVKEEPINEMPLQEEVGVIEEKPVDAIQLIKPVRIEAINLPNINMFHPEVSEIVDDIEPVRPRAGQLRVFVTGLDTQINSAVRVFLQKLGLETFNAHGERPNSEFIVEQFQKHSNQFDFAVVVLAPEEVVCQKFQTLEQGLWVTRQETIFELGFLVGKLGKGKVAVLYEEGPTRFKRPTEYFDLLYTPFDNNGFWQKRLINQLYAQGLIKEASLASV